MTFTVRFSAQFAAEFTRFQPDQQRKITEFMALYQKVGLSDFSKYEGKLAPSGRGLAQNDPAYIYAHNNALWHYHIGLPVYKQVHPTYKTSDWVLHFQWIGKGPRIDLVDLYTHYDSDGNFYMPPENSLV